MLKRILRMKNLIYILNDFRIILPRYQAGMTVFDY